MKLTGWQKALIVIFISATAFGIYYLFFKTRYTCSYSGACVVKVGGEYTDSTCNYECTEPTPTPSECIDSSDSSKSDYPWICDSTDGCSQGLEKVSCDQQSSEVNTDKNITMFTSEDVCKQSCAGRAKVWTCNSDNKCEKTDGPLSDSTYESSDYCTQACKSCYSDSGYAEPTDDDEEGHCCGKPNQAQFNLECSLLSDNKDACVNDTNNLKNGGFTCCWVKKGESCQKGCHARETASKGKKGDCGSNSNSWCNGRGKDTCKSDNKHNNKYKYNHCCIYDTGCGDTNYSDVCNGDN